MADRSASVLAGALLLAISAVAGAVPPPPPRPPPPPFPPKPESIEDICAGIAPVAATARARYEFSMRNTSYDLEDAARASASGPPLVREIEGQDLVRPDYPASLRGTGLKGRVLLELRVNETGQVQDAIALCSDHEAFSGAALEAARVSRFTPKHVNFIAVPTFVRLPFNF